MLLVVYWDDSVQIFLWVEWGIWCTSCLGVLLEGGFHLDVLNDGTRDLNGVCLVVSEMVSNT